MASLGGSFYSKNIADYYLTPYDLGYGPFVKFDHDFVGRAALEKMAAEPRRKKVTLVWNGDDVERAFGSLFHDSGDIAKYIDLPLANYSTLPYDKVVKRRQDDRPLHLHRLQLQRARDALAGDHRQRAQRARHAGHARVGRGRRAASTKPTVERHAQAEIRATVRRRRSQRSRASPIVPRHWRRGDHDDQGDRHSEHDRARRRPDGHVRNVLGAAETGTRVAVAVREVDPGKTYRVTRSEQTQVAYVLEGNDATVTHTQRGQNRRTQDAATRRASIWSPARKPPSPRQERRWCSCSSPCRSIPAEPTGDHSPAGYFFEESQLRSLVDEKGIPRADLLGQQGNGTLERVGPADRPHAVRAACAFTAARASRVENEPGDAGALLPHREGHRRSEARHRQPARRPRQPGADSRRRMASADRLGDRLRLHRVPGAVRFHDHDGSRPAGQELVHQGHRRRDRQAEALGPEL